MDTFLTSRFWSADHTCPVRRTLDAASEPESRVVDAAVVGRLCALTAFWSRTRLSRLTATGKQGSNTQLQGHATQQTQLDNLWLSAALDAAECIWPRAVNGGSDVAILGARSESLQHAGALTPFSGASAACWPARGGVEQASVAPSWHCR